MDIGKRLKELRRAEKLTQEIVAEKLQIDRSTLNGYENNRRTPTPEMLVRLSKFYKVPVDYILDNEI